MICEDCIHYPVCKDVPDDCESLKYYTFANCAEKCECFLNKNRSINLPCFLGDKVWCCISHTDIQKGTVTAIDVSVTQQGHNTVNMSVDIADGWRDRWTFRSTFGVNIFLTKEEAEKALNF